MVGSSHSNQLIPLYGYGAGTESLTAVAGQVDLVFDDSGNPVAGSGRSYTDQAGAGKFLMEQVRLGAQEPDLSGGDDLVGTPGDDLLSGGPGTTASTAASVRTSCVAMRATTSSLADSAMTRFGALAVMTICGAAWATI